MQAFVLAFLRQGAWGQTSVGEGRSESGWQTQFSFGQAKYSLLVAIHIIESVDSICRDSSDTQYMLIQTNVSKSPKQLTKNTPSGAKKHREGTEPESHQTAKMFFFLLLLQTG